MADSLSLYAQHFQAHIRSVSEHIARTSTLGPAQAHPDGTGWSPAEKNLFFHGLTVHSRLRPDLIAADIGTKTTVDVCVYLASLEAAAAEDTHRVARSALEPALEVSDDWIRFEEAQAAEIIAHEAQWDADHIAEDRRVALKTARREWNKRRKLEADAGKEHMSALVQIMAAAEAKEDFMSTLSMGHLKVFDSILRDAEGPATLSVEASSPGEQPAALPTTVNISDELIDSALLGMSQRQSVSSSLAPYRAEPRMPAAPEPALHASTLPPTLANHSISSLPLEQMQAAEADVEETMDLGALSPRSIRRHQKRMYMRRMRARLAGSTPSAQVVRLKPGRKTNKTRAPRTKLPPQPPPEEPMNVDLSQAQFTIDPDPKDTYYVGGKEETRFQGLFSGTSMYPTHEQQGGAEGKDDVHRAAPINIGGTTLPYKLKARCAELGIDASSLAADGMDMFHLSALGRLMRLYNTLSHVTGDVNTHVSGPLIQLLQTQLVSFLTELIHRTVVMREQEEASKGHTKVWRMAMGKKVQASNVQSALESMGALGDKQAHFSGLLRRMATCSQVAVSGTEEEDALDEDNCECQCDSEVQRDDSSHADDLDHSKQKTTATSIMGLGFSTARSINTPFVWHAYFDALNPNPFPGSSSADADTDALLPEQDTSALVADLLEDEEMDATDRQVAHAYETELCHHFGLAAPVVSLPAVDDDTSTDQPTGRPTGKTSRIMMPAAGRATKSVPYILESGSE